MLNSKLYFQIFPAMINLIYTTIRDIVYLKSKGNSFRRDSEDTVGSHLIVVRRTRMKKESLIIFWKRHMMEERLGHTREKTIILSGVCCVSEINIKK